MVYRWLSAGIALALLTAGFAEAQDRPARVANATRIVGTPPTIDGRLDDPAWAAATPTGDFVRQRPNPGTPATERTEVRILFDDDAIYVGMRMFDSTPDSIAAQLARRDATGLYSDWVHVVIDSYFDRRTAFRFAVNPRGVKRDVLTFDDVREDGGWDAVWEVGTRIDELGWTAEFRIPLTQLRFRTAGEGEELIWGINFIRDIARRDERAWWAEIPPGAGRMVSLFGELHGLRDLPDVRRLEILPYSVGRATRAPADVENPFYRATDLFGSVGADVKYGVTSDLTLTATVNPDFGQVEADPSRVNLGAFELFFPERRPFFTEGMDIFRFGISPGNDGSEQLFYSRRIGRTPQRVPRVSGGWVDMPEATRILGAGKLSGKTAGGWSLGLLTATTSAAEARIMDAQGVTRSEPVEPLTHYGIARVARDFSAGRSTLGGILTLTERRIDAAQLEFLPSRALSGGIDGRHRFRGDRFQLSGWVLASRVAGSEDAITRLQRSPARFFQRPDAPHLEFDPTRTSLQGVSGSLILESIGGERWQWGLLSLLRSPGFEVNDMGFQQFADLIAAGGFVGYNNFEPGPIFRRWGGSAALFPGFTFGGERAQVNLNANANAQLHNLWSIRGGINRNAEALVPWELRGGPALLIPGRTSIWSGFSTDARNPLVLNLGLNGSFQEGTGSRTVSLSPELSYRPASHINLSVGPNVSFNDDAWQYVQTVQFQGHPRYIYGRINQTTISATTRLNYTFTPDLSLELYAQPFLSGAGYSEFREVANPQAAEFEDRVPRLPDELVMRDREQFRYGVDVTGDQQPDFFFRDPDFNVRRFNSNAVLRWEYRAGSTLFLVWSQGRSGFDADGDFRFRRDVAHLFSTEPSNVLLIKLNYYLNL